MKTSSQRPTPVLTGDSRMAIAVWKPTEEPQHIELYGTVPTNDLFDSIDTIVKVALSGFNVAIGTNIITAMPR